MVGRVLKHWVKPHVGPFSLEHPGRCRPPHGRRCRPRPRGGRYGRRLHAGECRPHCVPGFTGRNRIDAFKNCSERRACAANACYRHVQRALQAPRSEQHHSYAGIHVGGGGSQLTLQGTGVINTNFLGVIGVSQIDIGATSVSTWGNTRLRVALVLDNTGSMSSSGKMTALKTAIS